MIYLDNAATTWPKPPIVLQALGQCLEQYGANPGRGGHSLSLRSGRMVLAARQALASFFGSNRAERWVFTGGATDSVNMALLGLLNPGDHVIASSLEHNAVARPLYNLAKHGVEVSFLDISPGTGATDPQEVERLLRPNTRLVAISHASNVTGVVQPLAEIIAVCRQGGSYLLLDAAQTAGLLPIDVETGIDLLAIPGHKSLYGPPGIGALYVSPGIDLRPYRFGGTGSHSESLEQPAIFPDRLESGTLNTPGIYALQAGLRFVQEEGLDQIYQREITLALKLVRGLRSIPGVTVYGWGETKQVPVIAWDLAGTNSTEVAMILDQSFQICSRAGLHCAPLVHKALGTLNQGLVRFSLGYYNTEEEIAQTISAVKEIAEELR